MLWMTVEGHTSVLLVRGSDHRHVTALLLTSPFPPNLGPVTACCPTRGGGVGGNELLFALSRGIGLDSTVANHLPPSPPPPPVRRT